MSNLSLRRAALVSLSALAASCASVTPDSAWGTDGAGRDDAAARSLAMPRAVHSSDVAVAEAASDDGAFAPSSSASMLAPRRAPKDPWEVTINGVGAANDDFSAGGTQFAGSVGYYFNKVMQLNLRQQVSQFDPGRGQNDIWNGATRVALDFHVPNKHVVPFAGIAAGWVYGDTTNETVVVGPEAGLKVYLKPDVFLLGMVEYQFFVDDTQAIGDAFDDGQFFYSFGFGVRF